MTHGSPQPPPQKTVVTDQWHKPPTPHNEARWLRRCQARLAKGFVHAVFTDDFTASLYRAERDLVMSGASRDGGLRFEVHCTRADLPTLRMLVSRFPREHA